MWVLILFYLSGGSPAVAMHDFSNKMACEQAGLRPEGLRFELQPTRIFAGNAL